MHLSSLSCPPSQLAPISWQREHYISGRYGLLSSSVYALYTSLSSTRDESIPQYIDRLRNSYQRCLVLMREVRQGARMYVCMSVYLYVCMFE